MATALPNPASTKGACDGSEVGSRTAEVIAKKAAADGIDLPAAEKALYGSALIGRIVEAEEVAAVATFLASPRSAAIKGDAIAAGGGTPRVIHY